MSRRLRHRKDGNHDAGVGWFQVYGWTVHDTHEGASEGGPDIFAAKHGRTVAAEFKMPGEPLRQSQQEWMDKWPGEKAIIRSLEDVARLTADIP